MQALLVIGEIAQHFVQAIHADGGEVIAQGAQVALGVGVQETGIHMMLDDLALDLQALFRQFHQGIDALQQRTGVALVQIGPGGRC